jgi:hypothetical protein
MTDLQCSNNVKRCADCAKLGKRYTSQYVSFCLYDPEQRVDNSGHGCWVSGVDEVLFSQCDPPVTLKACCL